MIFTVYRTMMRLAGPFLQVLLALRLLQGLEEKGHAREKTGRATLPRPSGKLIWIHAASNGEMLSVLPLVRKMLENNTDVSCLITTVTVTAARLTKRQGNPRILHQYAPMDNPAWVGRFLNHWRPDAVLWVESEIWPNTLSDIHARNIPLAMVNGRLSERSAKRWSRFAGDISTILSWFDVVLAQSADDARRLSGLGAKAIQAGNIKYAAPALPADLKMLQDLRSQIGARPALLFASTHGGEEEIAAQVYAKLQASHPDILIIVMPRHPRRGDEIVALLEDHKLRVVRRSTGGAIATDTQIYLADTLGEAGLFYTIAPIAFVGNSLITVPGGGHNLLEPAHLDCAILHGPHMWNFPEIERDLRAAGGSMTVKDADQLASVTARLLNDHAERQRLSDAALGFVRAQDQVLVDVAGHLRPLLARAGVLV